MEDDFIKKRLFNQIEFLVKDLEDVVKRIPLDKGLVNYSEGKLNGCIDAYFKLFPCETIPDSLWDNIVHAWSLIDKKKKEEEGKNEEQ